MLCSVLMCVTEGESEKEAEGDGGTEGEGAGTEGEGADEDANEDQGQTAGTDRKSIIKPIALRMIIHMSTAIG